jgi:hypothetical protein
MPDMATMLRGQFEAGVRYPDTFPGVLNTYGGSTRQLAMELDAIEGRAGRDPRSTQRSFQRYLRGERTPKPGRMRELRGLGRRRVARQRLSAYRARGARALLHGTIRISLSIRYVRITVELGPGEMAGTLDAAEQGMLTGRWGRAAHEFTREVMDKYGDLGDMAEPLEIDAVSITPL